MFDKILEYAAQLPSGVLDPKAASDGGFLFDEFCKFVKLGIDKIIIA